MNTSKATKATTPLPSPTGRTAKERLMYRFFLYSKKQRAALSEKFHQEKRKATIWKTGFFLLPFVAILQGNVAYLLSRTPHIFNLCLGLAVVTLSCPYNLSWKRCLSVFLVGFGGGMMAFERLKLLLKGYLTIADLLFFLLPAAFPALFYGSIMSGWNGWLLWQKRPRIGFDFYCKSKQDHQAKQLYLQALQEKSPAGSAALVQLTEAFAPECVPHSSPTSTPPQ